MLNRLFAVVCAGRMTLSAESCGEAKKQQQQLPQPRSIFRLDVLVHQEGQESERNDHPNSNDRRNSNSHIHLIHCVSMLELSLAFLDTCPSMVPD